MGLINSMNIWAFQLAKEIASPALNIAMHYFAESFLIVIPLVVIYMYIRKDKNVFSFVILFFVLYIIGEVIKYIVKEPRPCSVPALSWINNMGCESSFSFPSNHATVLTGLTFFTLPYKYLRYLYLAWLIVVLFGRVYLGLHYLSDVIAGIIISIVVVWPVYKYYSSKINDPLARIFCNLFGKLCPKKWENER